MKKALGTLSVFCVLPLLLVMLAHAQDSVVLNGRVLNQNNLPIPFVEVRAGNLGLKDTTDSDGRWEIKTVIQGTSSSSSGSSSSVQNGSSQQVDAVQDKWKGPGALRLESGVLSGWSTQAGLLDVQILNAQGQVEADLGRRFVGLGPWSVDLNALNRGRGVRYLRVKGLGQDWTIPMIQGQLPRVPANIAWVNSNAIHPKMGATYAETLYYSLQGQLITEDQIDTYRKYIEKYLVERNVDGQILKDSLNRGASIKNIRAHFSGGALGGELVTRLGWSPNTGDIFGPILAGKFSGKIYAVKSQEIYNFTLFVRALDSLDRAVARSISFPFNSEFGNLNLPDFMLGNALPRHGLPDTLFASKGSAFVFESLIGAADGFEGASSYAGRMDTVQMDFDGDGTWDWTTGSGVAQYTYPTVGQWMARIRLVDNERNVVRDSVRIIVQNLAPKILAQFTSSDSILTEKDSLSFAWKAKDSLGGRITILRADYNGDGVWDDSTTADSLQGGWRYLQSDTLFAKFEAVDDDNNKSTFQKRLLIQEGFWLSGKVIDQNLQPRAGVQVHIPRLGLSTLTDAQGVWTLRSSVNALSLGVPSSDTLRFRISQVDWVLEPLSSWKDTARQLKLASITVNGAANGDADVIEDSLILNLKFSNSTSRVRANLTGGQYSRTIYLSQSPLTDTVLVQAFLYGNSAKVTGISKTISVHGNQTGATLANFPAGNARPYAAVSWTGPILDTITRGDTIPLQILYGDSLGILPGIKNWEYSWDGLNWTSGNGTIRAVSPQGVGSHLFRVRIVDLDLNVLNLSRSLVVLRDSAWISTTSLPQFLSPQINRVYRLPLRIFKNFSDFTVQADTGSGFYNLPKSNALSVLDGGIPNRRYFPDTLVWTPKNPNFNLLKLRVITADGDTSLWTKDIQVQNDLPQLLGVKDTVLSGPSFTISWITASDSDQVKRIFDWGTGVFDTVLAGQNWSRSLPIGNYQVQVKAVDAFGATSKDTFALALQGSFTDATHQSSYQYRLIGNRMWLTTNVNYGTMVPGGNEDAQTNNAVVEKFCRDEDEALCEDYGAWYQWHEAMNLPAQCSEDGNQCAGTVTTYRQGLCPSGWYVPGRSDWENLKTTATGLSGATFAKSLLARGFGGNNSSGLNAFLSGWWNYDKTGSDYESREAAFISSELLSENPQAVHFDSTTLAAQYHTSLGAWDAVALRCAAIPADQAPELKLRTFQTTHQPGSPSTFKVEGVVGLGNSVQQFAYSADTGKTWTNIVNKSFSWTPNADGKRMIIARLGDNQGRYGYDTVRIQVLYHAVVQNLGGTNYRTRRIGSQTWMIQNLNTGTQVAASGTAQTNTQKFCYGDSLANCNVTGGLYQWHRVMNLATTCMTTDCAAQISAGNHQGICPTGWHIPKDADWQTLVSFATANMDSLSGRLLRASSGWDASLGQGLDQIGFEGQPGGLWATGAFNSKQSSAVYWTPQQNNAFGAWQWGLLGNTFLEKSFQALSKARAYSVRCVKD
jgi:uncharacterized protein (TIGR02145 family)